MPSLMRSYRPPSGRVRLSGGFMPVTWISATAMNAAGARKQAAAWWKMTCRKRLVVDGIERLGYFLSCGATQGQNLFDGTILTMKYFFDAIVVRQAESLMYRHMENIGDIARHPKALEEASVLGGIAAGRALWKTGRS